MQTSLSLVCVFCRQVSLCVFYADKSSSVCVCVCVCIISCAFHLVFRLDCFIYACHITGTLFVCDFPFSVLVFEPFPLISLTTLCVLCF